MTVYTITFSLCKSAGWRFKFEYNLSVINDIAARLDEGSLCKIGQGRKASGRYTKTR